jgi:superfamily II DNA/RNA helicase
LVPTHELAIQIIRVIDMINRNTGMNIIAQPIIGNVNITRQIENLKKKPNIIVGSAGRILELIKKKKIPAHQIRTIVLDEGDKLLDENNFEGVWNVIKTTLKDRSIWLFSATLNNQALERVKEITKSYLLIEEDNKISVPESIEHIYFLAEERDKIEVFRKVYGITKPQKAIIFVHKSFDTTILLEKLKYHGLSVERITGDAKKLERKEVMDNLKNGKTKLLIATDIAARGLDIDNVTHIFNLDLPQGHENYLHRCGRTGRNGKEGIVISILTKRELPVIKIFEKKLKVRIFEKDMFKGVIIDCKKIKKKTP